MNFTIPRPNRLFLPFFEFTKTVPYAGTLRQLNEGKCQEWTNSRR